MTAGIGSTVRGRLQRLRPVGDPLPAHKQVPTVMFIVLVTGLVMLSVPEIQLVPLASANAILANAIKFTPASGSVTVTLSAVGGDAIITVRDTGLGIARDELDQLYTRFFRASTATVNSVPGVGLGLSITKAIVTAHAGSLDAESEEGVGTTFRISLPVGSPAEVLA